MIKDRIKDLEDGNFDEGGMAFEGLDAPLANVAINAQTLSDLASLVKNDYYS